MRVWKVESEWTVELVLAKTATAALKKYEVICRRQFKEAGERFDRKSTEPKNINLVGEVE